MGPRMSIDAEVRINDQRKTHVASLDGLRFIAALSVAAAHYAAWTLPAGGGRDALETLSGLGMTLFFALSGFVIHYNYGATLREPNGLKKFAIARFSRLYPLYIVLFGIEFFLIWKHNTGSCGESGGALLFALPYYLTMTQDWFFGTVCKNNLIYQYGMMAQVTWSISAELFFYVVYCFYGRWARARRPLNLFVVAGIGYILLFIFVRACYAHRDTIENTALVAFGPIATEAHGYQDSLIRWLYYFWPMSQIVHFFGGVAAAQAFLWQKQSARGGALIVPLCAAAVLITHFYLYLVIAPTDGFVGRNASSFYGPLVVLAICAMVLWPGTAVPRLLSQPFMVKCGEASYSLYLLHAFLSPYLARPHATISLNGWALWSACLIFLLGLSRTSYVLFERPARNTLRKRLSHVFQIPTLPSVSVTTRPHLS